MTTLRRFVVLAALAFWLGGFTFYVSVVVPIGTDVLGSALDQGMITRRVTVWLNLAGACALAVLLWDSIVGDRINWRRALRLLLWLVLTSCQVALFVLHAHLDAMIDPEAMTVSDPAAFHLGHRAYLWAHTAQWFAGLAFMALMLKGWQTEDAARAVEQADDARRAAAWAEAARRYESTDPAGEGITDPESRR